MEPHFGFPFFYFAFYILLQTCLLFNYGFYHDSRNWTNNSLTKNTKFFQVYLDVGRAAGNTATLTFTVATAVALSRQWEAKVTQFHCGEAAA